MNKLKKEIIEAAMGPARGYESDKAVGRYLFPPGFIGFAGHFPGYPILPAFVQVLSALTVMRSGRAALFNLFL